MSSNERQFFDINNSIEGSNSKQRKETYKVLLRTEILDLYNYISQENERLNFVDNIVRSVGVPLWTKSLLYNDRTRGIEMIVLPLSKHNTNQISAIISAYKDGDRYVLNAINRNNLSSYTSESFHLKFQGAKALLKFDNYLFNYLDRELIDVICELTRSELTLLDPLAPTISCTPKFVKRCQDQETEHYWWGGLSNAPPHLDHDNDGILNVDDRDYEIFLNHYNITDEQFQIYIFSYWANKYYTLLGSYDDYWENSELWDDYNDDNSWDDHINDFWDEFWNEDDIEIKGPDDPLNMLDWDPNDQPGYDPPCYYPYAEENNGASSSRDVYCSWYFVNECTDGATTWYEDILNGDGSDQTGQDGEYDQQLQNKLRTFDEKWHADGPFNLLILATTNCNPFAPYSEFEICLATSMMEELEGLYPDMVPLDLDYNYETDRDYLINNPNLLAKIKVFMTNNPDAHETIMYFAWANRVHGISLNDLLQGYDEFTLNLPFVTQQETRIEIISSYVPTEDPSVYPRLAKTPFRPGHQYYPPNVKPKDMRHRTTGDQSLLYYSKRDLVNKTDEELLSKFHSLLHSSILNGDLQDVATDYYNRIVNKTGGDYFNPDLCEYLLDNSHMIATVKDFGKELNDRLKEVNGNLTEIAKFDIDNDDHRARFSTGEKFTGMKILVNDTELLIVYDIGDYSYDPVTKEWEASFYFQIFDNFGLDDLDLLKFQSNLLFGSKFAAWWVLQHVKDYPPFRTDIRAVYKIKGDLDN